MVRCLAIPKSNCYATMWCIVNRNTCSRLFRFSDITIIFTR